MPRHIPHPYPHFLPYEPVWGPQNQRKGYIFPDTFIGKTIVMFGINKVFRAKKGFPLLYRSGGSGV
jgi:hypothetical protein